MASSLIAARLLDVLSKYTKTPKEGTTYSTHGIHPYAAKFIPQLPARIIEECSNERHTILDPFCGSGTTLLEARLKGRNAIGFDINPIAVLISKVKTTPLSPSEWDSVNFLLERTRDRFDARDYSGAWIPSIPRLTHWFPKDAIMDLGLIAGELQAVRNDKVRKLLELAYSSIIVTVSNQESETRFAAVEKKRPQNLVKNLFLRKVRTISDRVKSLSTEAGICRSSGSIFLADARRMTEYISRRSADLVVTSPPYLNSYDYYLYHKFRMYWLGFDKDIMSVEKVRRLELGSRFEYSGKRGKSIETFRKEMYDCFLELSKVTKPSKLIFVAVGDSILRDQFISMDSFYEEIAKKVGMDFIAKTSYPLRDITRSFKTQQALRSGRKLQHILVFRNRSNNHNGIGTPPNVANNTPRLGVSQLTVEEIPRTVATGSTLLITTSQVSAGTHGLVKYPSKFIPEIPRWAIQSYTNAGDLILDPFVGCGTTLVEARLLSRNSLGFDINPFAVLMSKVKATPIYSQILENTLKEILQFSKKSEHVKTPKFPLRDFWFDMHVLRRLVSLRSAIHAVAEGGVRDFFQLVLGQIIRPCSYLDESQIKVERDQTKLMQGVPNPIQLFTKRAVASIHAMSQFYAKASPGNFAEAYVGDSRRLSTNVRNLGIGEADLVITSPPYINAINYSMYNRYELLLLELVSPSDYINHQRSYLGTERVYVDEYDRANEFHVAKNTFVDLNTRLREIGKREMKRAYIARSYFEGMVTSIEEIHKILRRRGKFVVVAGSNEIKGVKIPTYEILRQCAEEIGFSTLNVFAYQIRNHRFKITRHETGRQIKIDNIIVMEKK